MAFFLDEPRYSLGILGFFTEPLWGKRILRAGAAISAVGILGAAISGIELKSDNHGLQAIFLIASAWLLIFGVMRLFWTGALWILSQVFDWIANGIPSTASALDFIRRTYWVGSEVFLTMSFLSLLVAAVFVGIGYLSPP